MNSEIARLITIMKGPFRSALNIILYLTFFFKEMTTRKNVIVLIVGIGIFFVAGINFFLPVIIGDYLYTAYRLEDQFIRYMIWSEVIWASYWFYVYWEFIKGWLNDS